MFMAIDIVRLVTAGFSQALTVSAIVVVCNFELNAAKVNGKTRRPQTNAIPSKQNSSRALEKIQHKNRGLRLPSLQGTL